MHLSARPQWITISVLTVILSTLFYQEVSAGRRIPVRVTRSAVESLRDHGTYIVHFKSHVTEKELHQFSTILMIKSMKERNFFVEIIEKLFVIKYLTARLSRRALNWVRAVYICKLTIIT